MKSLTDIKAQVDRLAAIIGASGYHGLPSYGPTKDYSRPHVEVDARGYHLVIVEHGLERGRFTTGELDELLFHIFQHVTCSLAVDYELAHRIQTQDCRRLGFQKQIELLSQISKQWAEREAAEHQHILRGQPFDDYSGVRADLIRELKEAGESPQSAWETACKRYPLPVRT
jgi:hypothetical protein